MQRMIRRLAVAVTVIALAGCSGAGAGNGGDGGAGGGGNGGGGGGNGGGGGGDNAGIVFGPATEIDTSTRFGRAVHAADLDGDGDADVLASFGNTTTVYWYENDLGDSGDVGTFSTAQRLPKSGGDTIHATDLDLDGDADILYSDI